MTGEQLQVYGARIRLAWFRAAEELGSVTAACKHYGIARSEYYYWHKRWRESGRKLTSLYDLPRTPKSHSSDLDEETTSLIVQLRLSLGYGEAKLAVVLARDYDVLVSRHGVGNVLRRAGLTMPKRRKPRHQRELSDYAYQPGEVGQMDVKHWKHAAYQYDIVDCATRIRYKRLYPGVNPAYTVDFLEHAVRFFAPAFSFQCIQTDNGTEFVYNQLPQKSETAVDAEGNIVEDRFGKPVPSYSSRQMNRAIKLIDRDLNNEKIENVIRQEEAHAKEASRKKGDAYDILYGKDKRN